MNFVSFSLLSFEIMVKNVTKSIALAVDQPQPISFVQNSNLGIDYLRVMIVCKELLFSQAQWLLQILITLT